MQMNTKMLNHDIMVKEKKLNESWRQFKKLQQPSIMLYRNLLYTGITRAKKRVVLIGQKQVLFMAIHRNEIVKRNTLLGTRIGMYYKAYAKRAGIPVPAALEEELKYAG